MCGTKFKCFFLNQHHNYPEKGLRAKSSVTTTKIYWPLDEWGTPVVSKIH